MRHSSLLFSCIDQKENNQLMLLLFWMQLFPQLFASSFCNMVIWRFSGFSTLKDIFYFDFLNEIEKILLYFLLFFFFKILLITLSQKIFLLFFPVCCKKSIEIHWVACVLGSPTWRLIQQSCILKNPNPSWRLWSSGPRALSIEWMPRPFTLVSPRFLSLSKLQMKRRGEEVVSTVNPVVLLLPGVSNRG